MSSGPDIVPSHVQEPTSSTIVSESPTVINTPQPSTFKTTETLASKPAFPVSIPPATPDKPRNLVLCFDGTGDQFDSDNSNIVQFFSMLKKDDSSKQMVYYQAGIGTYTSPEIATPFTAKISKLVDEAIAWNLSAHVMEGYEFLMQNYRAGDRICIFGFSRGAYTARSLAGMIHKVGLLPACNHQQVPFAFRMYSRADEIGWAQSNAFKKAFSVDVPIEFLGVWDTVASVGLIPKTLPFTTSNTIVHTFRHAVSLDEHRAKFKANLWNRPTVEESSLGVEGQKPEIASPTPSSVHVRGKKKAFDGDEEEYAFRALEARYAEKPVRPTDVEEVWFSGCHCDVGGGSVDNGTPHTLAQIPLRWMIRECFKADSGIIFISDGLRNIGLDPASVYPSVQTRPPPLPVGNARIQSIPSTTSANDTDSGANALVQITMSEEEHELLDALSPLYDQLELAKGWWILEVLPLKRPFQRSNNSWAAEYWPNLGNPRFIPQQKKRTIKVHRSVKMRMEAEYEDGSKYRPKASFADALTHGNVEWID